MSFFISRTPFRVSFLGGGTDYPDWYLREGGATLSTTIDKYCYVSCRYLPPYFNMRHRIVWSHIEKVQSISEILHPAVRKCLESMGFEDDEGIEIHHQADLPARSGMGSSSSFAVGLINAMVALRGETIDKKNLANAAIRLEQRDLKESVGSQDQVAAAYGGFNVSRFNQDGTIDVTPVAISAERKSLLEQRMMLFFTGINRHSSEIARDIIKNIPKREETLRTFQEFVDQGLAIAEGEVDLDDFGRLLDQAWNLKRGLADMVSNSDIDDVYARAMKAGALGGKILGAGAGGFMLFYVPPERREDVIKAVSPYFHVPFLFENRGSTLIDTGF